MIISNALNSAAELLRLSGVVESRKEASSLLAFVLQKEPVFLIAHPGYELTEFEKDTFESLVQRRTKREPFQYIVGRQEFYGLEFVVRPGVLIPRPETEILVENALGILSEIDRPQIFEIGVGSGCIAISILHNVTAAHVVGVDVSNTALTVAYGNAAIHGVDKRLTLVVADVFDGLSGEFDLIVSNPPYVPNVDRETMQAEVVGFEPHTALFGGPDGLDIVKRIVSTAPDFLRPKGYLLIEIGFGQSESVKVLYDAAVWEFLEFIPDLQGIPRIVKSRLRG